MMYGPVAPCAPGPADSLAGAAACCTQAYARTRYAVSPRRSLYTDSSSGFTGRCLPAAAAARRASDACSTHMQQQQEYQRLKAPRKCTVYRQSGHEASKQ